MKVLVHLGDGSESYIVMLIKFECREFYGPGAKRTGRLLETKSWPEQLRYPALDVQCGTSFTFPTTVTGKVFISWSLKSRLTVATDLEFLIVRS